MKKSILLFAILALVGSVSASANPISDKIDAYNSVYKKSIKGKGDSQTSSDSSLTGGSLLTGSPLSTSNSNDTLMDARLVAATSLNYTAFKSLETVHDAFQNPTEADYAGYEESYKQEKATYDTAVSNISYSYLNQNGGHLLDNELKIRNLANSDVNAYKQATPNATQQELADVQANSIKTNSGLLTGLTTKYQNELQAARDAFELNMNGVRSANRGGNN